MCVSTLYLDASSVGKVAQVLKEAAIIYARTIAQIYPGTRVYVHSDPGMGYNLRCHYPIEETEGTNGPYVTIACLLFRKVSEVPHGRIARGVFPSAQAGVFGT